MRATTLALLAGFILAAGCIQLPPDPDHPLSSGQPSFGPSISGTPGPPGSGATASPGAPGSGSPAPPHNATDGHAPPRLQFTASTLGGPTPLHVDFTFDAVAAEGANLAWRLDADGDGGFEAAGHGDTLPGAASFSYLHPRWYNATFFVDDGRGWIGQSIAIDAKDLRPQQTSFMGWERGTACGPVDPAAAQAVTDIVGVTDPQRGVTYGWTTLVPGTQGRDYRANFSASGTLRTVVVAFYDKSYTYLGGNSAAAAPWSVRGTVPDTALYVATAHCGTGPASAYYGVPGDQFAPWPTGMT